MGGNVDHLELDPHPNFHLLGKIKDSARMKELHRKVMVFAQPHRFDRSPHVLIESMSGGKPIVTTKQGAAPEVVRHGETGFLIHKGDVDALVIHLIELLKDKKKCIQFGKRAKEVVAEGYTWERIAEKMLTHIEQTL